MNQEVWAELSALKRTVIRQAQRAELMRAAMLDKERRISVLESEVADLQRAREMHHEDVELEIAEIMQR